MRSPLRYPLAATFGYRSGGGQRAWITDADGLHVLYVKQRAFSLRKRIEVYADETATTPLWRIAGDRVFGWVKYRVCDAEGRVVGTLQRAPGSKRWWASYQLLDAAGAQVGTVHQAGGQKRTEPGQSRVRTGAEAIAALAIKPSYRLEAPAGTPVLRLVKTISPVARYFSIESVAPLNPELEGVVIPQLLTLMCLERVRT